MALATLQDLQALGAIKVNVSPTAEQAVRGLRLIELASAQVAQYVGSPETTIIADWSVAERDVIASVVAEAASSRLNVSAAPSTDPYVDQYGYSSVLLNRRHYATLDRLLTVRRGPRGLFSIGVTRGDLEVVDWPELRMPGASDPTMVAPE